MSSTGTTAAQDSLRERILGSAAGLLRDGGLQAVTTRAVEAAADVQAPTLYRLFGDKQGLLEAVAEREISAWVATKAAAAKEDLDRDPVEVLRDGWLAFVRFGLENPALFILMHERRDTDRPQTAERLGQDILRARVRRVAASGRLAVTEERAIDLITATARGAVLTLLAKPPTQRELDMLDDVLDGLLATTITASSTSGQPPNAASHASALRASLQEQPHSLTPGETALLDELLIRIGQQRDTKRPF